MEDGEGEQECVDTHLQTEFVDERSRKRILQKISWFKNAIGIAAFTCYHCIYLLRVSAVKKMRDVLCFRDPIVSNTSLDLYWTWYPDLFLPRVNKANGINKRISFFWLVPCMPPWTGDNNNKRISTVLKEFTPLKCTSNSTNGASYYKLRLSEL